MCLKEFLKSAEHLSKNPLGILGLFTALILYVLYVFASNQNISDIQTLLVVLFLFGVLIVYYKLVTEHHTKLYAPYDFQNEEHFVNLVNKVDNLESIMKKVQNAINDQAIYKYSNLSIAGRRLILITYMYEKYDLTSFSIEREIDENKAIEEAKILESYGWVSLENKTVQITEKGKTEVEKFMALTLGPFA
uniref:Uncharacterized protein n=1 Tax=Methanococcus maripaludis (strain C6 / ATCC BAA-1332) TaxID=444158 RepID=A9A7K2_METM6